MKTKNICLFSCMLLLGLLTAVNTMAQHAKAPITANSSQAQKAPEGEMYTYILFVAPNKVYGYNIFRNGKIVYHQPAMAELAGDEQPILIKKPQADKAAMLAIEKLKMGKPAELTRAELLSVTAH